MKIPAELKELSQLFSKHKKKLYIVGGFVRDSYLGVQSVMRDDIDLCSNAKPDELEKILKNSSFEIKDLNERLGVFAIYGKKRYEYATFRKESYEDESHNPNSVEFIDSLEEDALRRDFKINAIYYDIEKDEYIDPTGGIIDLKERQISTVRPAKIVFNDDPERILRLIRFACSLGLSIPEEELWYARKNSYKIKFITKFRLRREFERLLTVDEVYPDLLYTKNAHFRAMVLLGEIKCWKYILPAVYELESSSITDFKGERIYDHIMNCLKNSSPSVRLAILLHDSGKFKTMSENKKFFGANDFVKVIVEKNLGLEGLGYSKETVSKVTRTIIGYDFNKYCLASKSTVKKFVFENYDIIDDIIEIKTIIKNEGQTTYRKSRSAEILRSALSEIQREKAPLSVKELKIDAEEIIRQFPSIKLETIGTLLDQLLIKCVISPKNNNREDLLKLVAKTISSKRDFYIEQ